MTRRNRHSAFSFIEVLFAVILLGIGFIMIAGIFPVAIQQTSIVSSETQGSAIIRDAVKKIQAAADAGIGSPPATAGTTNSIFQPTMVGGNPTVMAFTPNIMQALGSDSFFSADRRFGWVGFYRRDSATSPFAQVFIVALQNPNFPNYVTQYPPGETAPFTTMPPILPPVAPPIPPLQYNYYKDTNTADYTPATPPGVPPASCSASYVANFTYDPTTGTSTVKLTGVPSAVTGAYIIVGSPPAASGSPWLQTPFIGRIFRIGTQIPTLGINLLNQTFYLQPGWDLNASDVPYLTGGKFSANIWVIGAAPTLGSGTEYTGLFTGPNQDIGAGSAFIRVNTSNN